LQDSGVSFVWREILFLSASNNRQH